jgi:membrane protein
MHVAGVERDWAASRPKRFRRLRHTSVARFCAKLNADLATRWAVVIAWQCLFSLFPILLGLLGVFGQFVNDPDHHRALAAGIAAQFPAQFADLLAFIEHTGDASTVLGLVSLVGLAWSGYWLFRSMEFVFNRFYGVANRSLHGQAWMALLMTSVYVVLTTVSVLASEIPHLLVALAEHLPFEVPWMLTAVGNLVALASAVLLFLALYAVVPNCRLTPWDVWPGAVLAGLLFVLLSQAFPLYFWLFGGSYAVYQAFGLSLLLMTWFHFLAMILVLGAELNAFLGGHGVS